MTALRQDRRFASVPAGLQLTTILPCRDKTEFFIGIGGSFYESACYAWRGNCQRSCIR
jgi:hypothetical protein